MKSILVCIDFSQSSDNALDWGISLAGRFQWQLLLLHVFEPVPGELKVFEKTFAEPSFRNQAETDLAALRARVPSELNAHALLREAKTAWREILQVAEEHRVELILLGRQGSKLLDRLLLGNTAKHVLKHAQAAILLAARENSPPIS